MFNYNKMRNLRKKSQLLQSDLAEKLNLSTSTIGMWEQGRAKPDDESIIKMAQLFGVTTDYLLDNELSVELQEQQTENKELVNNVIDGLSDPLNKVLYSKIGELRNEKDKQIVLNIINSFIEEVDNK